MKPIKEAPGIDARPVLDSRGFVILFDLWVARQWIGSCRTIEQCEHRLSHYCDQPIEASPCSPW